MTEQNFANHRKFVPGYHYVALGILVINLIWSLFRLVRGLPEVPVFDRLLGVAVAVALLLLAWYLRVFPLQGAGPGDPPRGDAAPGEAPAAGPPPAHPGSPARPAHRPPFRQRRRAPRADPDGARPGFTSPDEIKKLVRSWRADHLRM